LTDLDRPERVVPVRAERRSRRYDSERGCYVYDISFRTRAPLTDRTMEVAKAFGLGVDDEREHVLYSDFELRLVEGDVVYITGDSGSGKDRPIIDTVGGSFVESLGLLSRVGLNDAFLFLRRYGELSEGQRYRYRIAGMIDEGKAFWLADEFCSALDRTTARVVAFNIQKLARRSGATLVVATTHADFKEDLGPSITIRKGWGEEIDVAYGPNMEVPACTVAREVSLREGSREDYRRLGHLHYRDAGLPVPREIYAMERGDELVGVIVYSYPPVRAAGRRRAVGYVPDLEELNRDWAVISRVIVHPKYRTIGLGSRLVRESLRVQGCGHVELIAVMAQYNPFAERAGMRLVQVSEPHGSVVRAIEGLHGLGFNPVLMASEGYNRGKLEGLDGERLRELGEVLLSVSSVYYKRLSRAGRPYVRKAGFREWLGGQDAGSLARTLSVLCTLGQSKAYLYWGRCVNGSI
jgi:predicted ABC-type transport system involved in lysophospholipase L1 biosynthesis ATPase subunit/GNAT superfamily N-acetyltransferase